MSITCGYCGIQAPKAGHVDTCEAREIKRVSEPPYALVKVTEVEGAIVAFLRRQGDPCSADVEVLCQRIERGDYWVKA